jgi:hypothetical protein
MSVVRMDALCECDGCQKRFGVEIDIGFNFGNSVYADFDDLARDTIRGGQANYYTWGVRGKATVDRLSLSGFPSIQADLMLCDECTRKCDDLPVEGNLTLAQVHQALGIVQP